MNYKPKRTNYTGIMKALYGGDTEQLEKDIERKEKAADTRKHNQAIGNTEFQIAQNCVKWLNLQYPKLMFDVEYTSELKLSGPQRGRFASIQPNDFKRPDFAIYEPIGNYTGMFIELKKSSPYTKDFTRLLSNEHNQYQAESMKQLYNKGYYCTFAWSFEMFQQIINAYMSGQPVSGKEIAIRESQK